MSGLGYDEFINKYLPGNQDEDKEEGKLSDNTPLSYDQFVQTYAPKQQQTQQEPFQLRMAKQAAQNGGTFQPVQQPTQPTTSGTGGLDPIAALLQQTQKKAQAEVQRQTGGFGSETRYVQAKQEAERLAKANEEAQAAKQRAYNDIGAGAAAGEFAYMYDDSAAQKRYADASKAADEAFSAFEAARARQKELAASRFNDTRASAGFAEAAAKGAADSRSKLSKAAQAWHDIERGGWGPEAEINYGLSYADAEAYRHMTDDEKQIYHYLLGARGEEAADDYLQDMREELNRREGEKRAERVESLPGVVRLPVELGQAGASGLMNAVEGLGQNLSSEANPTSPLAYQSQYIKQNIEKHDGPKIAGRSIEGIGYDAVNTMGNMVPSLAAGAINPVAGAVTMGLQSKGNAYKQALDAGYTKGQAQVYSTVTGAAEAGLQYLLGGFSKLGGIEQFTGKLTGKIGSAGLRAAAELGIENLGENTEEYLQNKIEPLLRNAVFGENNEVKVWDDEDTYTLLLTTLTTSTMNGGERALRGAANAGQAKTVGEAWIRSGHDGELVERAAQSDDAMVRNLAQGMKQGDRAWTAGNIGQIAIGYELSGGDLGFVVTENAQADQAATEALREATGQTAPAAENPAQSVENERESAGDISAPPSAQNASTGDSERLNRASLSEETESVAGQEKTAPEGAEIEPAADTFSQPEAAPGTATEPAPVRTPAGDFTPKKETRWNPKSERGKAEMKAARKLHRESGLWDDSTAAAQAVHRVAESMRDRRRGTDVMEIARKAADEMMQSQKSGIESGDRDLYNKLREYLRGQKIQISDELRGDITDYNEWRKSMFGKLRLAKAGLPIDSVYAELSQVIGEGFFPPDITAHSDQVNRILNVLDAAKPQAIMMSEAFSGQDYTAIRDAIAGDLAKAAAQTVGWQWANYEPGSTMGYKSDAAKRYDAIQQEIDVASWDGQQLSQEEASRLVDERYMQYGVYDLSELLNETESEGEESEYGTDDEGEEAAALPRNDEAETEWPADAGDSENVGAGIQSLAERDVPAGRQTGSLNPPPAATGGEVTAAPAMKRSQTESNTLSGVAEKLGGEQNPLYYMPVTERQTLNEAVNRVMADGIGEMERLADKEHWTAADVDTAMTIYGKLQADGVRNRDFSAAQSWSSVIQSRGTSTAQALQAFSKWTRSGAGQASAIQQQLDGAVEDYEASGGKRGVSQEEADRITNDVYDFAQEYDALAENDLAGLRELIRRMSDYRKTGTFVKGLFGNLLDKVQDADYLREYALRQMSAIASDATETADFGQKLKTWQVNAQLTRLGTFFRNLGGNALFGVQDTLTQDGLGVALDMLISRKTGKRTVGTDKGWFSAKARKAAVDALQRSVLEIAGDVNMSGDASKYGTTANRTFKMTGNAFERFMSRWEQLLGYSLQSSDAFFRGQIEASQQESLESIDSGLTKDEKRDLAESMADYRLFQNKGKAYGISKGMHDVLNLLGVGGKVDAAKPQAGRSGGFGLGDFTNPYPGVPANIGVKTLEYSPANVVKGARQLLQILHSLEMGTFEPSQQRDAVMNIARGLSGVPIIAILAAAFKSGIVKNSDDEDDLDEAAQDRAEGKTGVQINLSAWARSLDGDTSEWRDGDELMSVGWLEPLNGFMAIASLIAQDDDEDASLNGYAKHYFNGAVQSVLEIPAMKSLSGMVDAVKYSDGEGIGEKALGAAVSLAGDSATGMIPAPLSSLAKATDKYQRDTRADTTGGEVLNRLYAAIPYLRQTMDVKTDGYGKPIENPDSSAMRVLNELVLPGRINQLKQTETSAAMKALHEATGERTAPDRKAPKSVKENGETRKLTTAEKKDWEKAYGESYEASIRGMMQSDGWAALTEDQRLKVLTEARTKAKAAGKAAIRSLPDEETTDKVAALKDPNGYMTAKEALKAANDSKDYTKMDELLKPGGLYTKLPDDAKELLDTPQPHLDDMAAAAKIGVKSEKWTAVYEEKRRLEGTKGSSTQKATQFAAFLDRDKSLTEKQKELLREQMGFYAQIRAEADNYKKLTGAGMDTDMAEKVTATISGLSPLPGKTQVSQDQKVDAILSSGWDEAAQWRALKVYTSESFYDKAAEAYRRGIDLDDYVRQTREADANGKSGLSQDELWDFFKKDSANEAYVRVMWLINGWKTDWDTYKRTHR